MPDRAGPAVLASLAPSLAGSSPVTDTLSAVDWPGSYAAVSDTAVPDTAVADTAVPGTAVPGTAVPGTAVPGTAVPDTAVPDTAVSGEAADDWPADDWPTDDGPADEGPGLVVSWTGGVTIGQVLSAVDRYQRHRAGLDLPAWGEVGHTGKPDDPPAGDPGPGPQDD